MKVFNYIEVDFKYTNSPETAAKWLNELDDVFAADFEAAIRYSPERVQQAKENAANLDLPKKKRVLEQAIAKATPLGHPSHTIITHLSVACSEDKAFVIVIDSEEVADVVLEFLVTTDKTQIWHNYCFDGRLIRYYTYRDAKNVEDTQILAKTLLNHVETFKAKTSLKELAGQWYGEWAVSADNFTLAQIYDLNLIKYAATDACATYKLWKYLQQFLAEEDVDDNKNTVQPS